MAQHKIARTLLISVVLFGCGHLNTHNIQKSSNAIPHLIRAGNTHQLIVENAPYLMLAGELGNSTFTSEEAMLPVWPQLKAMNVNTLLAPVFWELIEPTENNFDFSLLDQQIQLARQNNIKLVLLWFGSWKNSMSSHAPAWVKQNAERFPRAVDKSGKRHELLSPFYPNNLQADLNAFTALVKHIKAFDQKEQTVIMLQVENETGMLPNVRDYSAAANALFERPVPRALHTYLLDNNESLVPELQKMVSHGGPIPTIDKVTSWEEMFGRGIETEELFMAWYYARFSNALIEAGKNIYPLPMFVNAALNRDGALPGEGYPSAGPLPHLMDIWKAGAPAVDFFSPDIYFPNFKHWADLYARNNNPLFIPEHRFDNTVAAKAAYTIGHYQGLGFSPFSIETGSETNSESLGEMYKLLEQLSPLILTHQGLGKIEGVLLDKETPSTKFILGDYEFTVKHSHTLGWEANSKNDIWEPAGAVIIQTSADEFYIAGTGIVATFKNVKNPQLEVGILKTEEGRFNTGEWQIIRHLNGDQTHQGRHLRIFLENYAIQRLELYNY